MLAFAVHENKQPLAQWPGYTSSRAFCIYLADAGNRPREKSFDFDYGRLACYCPPGVSRRLFIRYPVREFGDPVLRTPLLQSGRSLHNLAVELALGRMEFIDEQRAKAQLEGRLPSRALGDRIEKARAMALRAREMDADGERGAAAALADDALAISVPAGEELAAEVAGARLAERRESGGLRDFLFGCTGGGFNAEEKRGRYFLRAFNYATLGFYLNGIEPEPGRVQHERLLADAKALRSHGIRIKGHPLVWTYTPCIPPHRRGMDFDTCCEVFRKRIERDVPPFRDLIEFWDVINEAHDTPWANSMAFSSGQMIELTAIAAAATRKVAAPGSKIVVNVCLPFGEYAAGAPGRATTLEYVRGCIDAGVDFDIIGIQFYYGGGLLQYCWDMLEVSRILDEYAALGKEIHITELGTPSAMGPDPNAMITEGNEVGLWHGEWTQATQADWVEQFYKICMSKPAIRGITWWSFSDAVRVFWPHGGLLDKNDEPKQALLRLLELREMAESG